MSIHLCEDLPEIFVPAKLLPRVIFLFGSVSCALKIIVVHVRRMERTSRAHRKFFSFHCLMLRVSFVCRIIKHCNPDLA